ncbi:hypothetical protein GCM10009534_28890 [Kribbella sandramycini]
MRDWMRATAIALPNFDGYADWEPALHRWAPALGDVRVVGLGEATHGTREFFQLKALMVRYLVERAGFRVFALEAPGKPAPAVNAYIQGDAVDPVAALTGLASWPWRTEEVLALLEWMRSYNQSCPASERVRFIGVDPLDPDLFTDVPETPRTEEAAAESFWAVRDRQMAEAILEAAANDKVVFWGHNGHVGMEPFLPGAPTTGQVLREKLGTSYYAVGLLFGRGSLRAFRSEPTNAGEPDIVHRGRPVPWSAEAALGRALGTAHLLDLRAAPPDAARWLGEQRWVGGFGADSPRWPILSFNITRLATAYDAIAYLPTSSPSRPLPK